MLVIDEDATLGAIPDLLPSSQETRRGAFDVLCHVLRAPGRRCRRGRGAIGTSCSAVWLRSRSRISLRTGTWPQDQTDKNLLADKVFKGFMVMTEPQGNQPVPAHKKYDQLIARAGQVPPARSVVVHPCDESSLRGAVGAAEIGLINPILVGPAAKIASVAQKNDLDISRFEIIDVTHSEERLQRQCS